jgi:hypothetical protein
MVVNADRRYRRIVVQPCAGVKDGRWCPWCYENVKGRASHKGHRAYRPRLVPQQTETLEMALRKRDAAQAEGGGVEVQVCGWMKRLPHLWEWLTETQYEDGSPRVLPTINLFVDGNCVKAFLNDRDQSLSLCVSAGSFTALLEALERVLEEGDGEWRESGYGKKKRR